MIYVHVTNTYRSKRRTGIQRLVVSLGNYLLRDNRFGFIAFDHLRGSFFSISDCSTLADAIYEEKFTRIPFALDQLGAGDVFFELDAVWGDGIRRTKLYRKLKRRGVIIVGMHYDAAPILFSAYSHPDTVLNYLECFSDLVNYADYMLAISATVECELQTLAAKYHGFRVTSRVIPLGSDFCSAREQRAAGSGSGHAVLDGRPYFLSVGTLEPRKNHDLLLQAFERIKDEKAALVMVGEAGWHTASFFERLTGHPDFGRRIFWLEDVRDDALAWLYENCHACVVTSHYEGYGLPAAEALALRCPTIVSDAGALPEVVGKHGIVVATDGPGSLSEVLERTLRDPAYHAELKRRACSYRPTSWAASAEYVLSFVGDIVNGVDFGFDAPPRQLVSISIDGSKLALSLASVKSNMPFIEHLVVLTQRKHAQEISRVAHAAYADAVVLHDEDLLAPQEQGIRDHQSRNTTLRYRLYQQPCIETNFIAADDDYLAICAVTAEQFNNYGIHQAYYFLSDLGYWLGAFPAMTSYDVGLLNTWTLLRKLGYPTRAYSCHMPQIINKRLANLIFARFIESGAGGTYDEWSLYFNVASHLYPKRFALKPYATMGWPADPRDWLAEIVPEQIQFENYSPNSRKRITRARAEAQEQRQTVRIEDYLTALRRARMVELGEGEQPVRPLVLTVTDAEIEFDSETTLSAGHANLRRVLIHDKNSTPEARRLEMTVLNASGKAVRHTAAILGKTQWLPLYPPDEEGLYWIVFQVIRGRKPISSLTVRVRFEECAAEDLVVY